MVSQHILLVSTVNEHVATALSATSSRKRSNSYHRCELEMKGKNIGRYAAENGNKATITKFSGALGFDLHASTVTSFKRAYYMYKQLQSVKDPDAITKLEGKKHG